MSMRNLFAVANLLVELSSVNHASQNHQHNTTSIILTAVLGWRSAPDPVGSSQRSPDFVFSLGWGHLPHYPPLDAFSVSF